MKNKIATKRRQSQPPPRAPSKQSVTTKPPRALPSAPQTADDRLRQLSRAVEQSPVSVVITDTQGNIEYVNPKFTQVTGYTLAEVIGKNPRILKSGEKSSEEYRRMWNTISVGQEWHGEFHNKKKNGELYWESAVLSAIINSQGKITHYLAVKEDITERKLIEERLRASEEYARSIVESSLDIIIVVDQQRRITEFNAAAQDTFGYSRDEVIGKHINMLYADGQQAQSVHEAVFRQGKLVQEVWNKRKNGEVFPSYLSAAVMRNEQGDLLGIVGMSRDITESKQSQKAIARRDATLSAVTFAAERFLRTSSWATSLLEVLERLGQANQVSRVYLFENYYDHDQTLYWRPRGEWVAPGIAPQIANPELQNLPVTTSGLGRWRSILEKDDWIQGHVKDLPDPERRRLSAQDTKSLVIVPIFAKQAWWGFIGFDECVAEREWSAPEVDALVAAADTLGGAIERERVEQELKTRVHHLALLNEITRASISTSDLPQMLQLIADRLGGLLDADGCLITLWDEERQRTIPTAASGPLREAYPSMSPEPGEATLTESVLNTGHPLVIENALETQALSRRIVEQFPAQSVLCLPLMDSGHKLGAAIIGFNQPHRFFQNEIELGAQAAAQIALAIVKAQSLDAAQQRAMELEALRQASLSLTSSLDLPAVLDAILASTMRLAPDAQDTHIYLYEHEQLTFGSSQWKDGRKGQEWSPPRPEGLTYTVARRGEAIIVPDMRQHPLFIGAPSNWQGAIIGLPLNIGNRVVGVMTVAFDQARTFSENELRALRLLATQAAIAIENARLYVQVRQLAVTDSLTGLLNRRGFYQIGAIEFERAWRFDRPLSAMMVDVDHFKQINDAYTHAVGDKILIAIADAFRHSLRTVDVVGRYGGEEFVVLLPEADTEVAARVAERVRSAVADLRVPVNGAEVHVTISVGVATMSRETPDLQSLIERADQAQYRAKDAGRNHVVVIEN